MFYPNHYNDFTAVLQVQSAGMREKLRRRGGGSPILLTFPQKERIIIPFDTNLRSFMRISAQVPTVRRAAQGQRYAYTR